MWLFGSWVKWVDSLCLLSQGGVFISRTDHYKWHLVGSCIRSTTTQAGRATTYLPIGRDTFSSSRLWHIDGAAWATHAAIEIGLSCLAVQVFSSQNGFQSSQLGTIRKHWMHFYICKSVLSFLMSVFNTIHF